MDKKDKAAQFKVVKCKKCGKEFMAVNEVQAKHNLKVHVKFAHWLKDKVKKEVGKHGDRREQVISRL